MSTPHPTLHLLRRALIVGCLACASSLLSAAISLTGPAAYTQDFNISAINTNSGTFTWVDDSTVPGWYGLNDGAAATEYRATNGGTNPVGGNSTGLMIFRRGAGDNQYSLGTLSGTHRGAFGVQFQNNTGQTITQLVISYTGKQWTWGSGGADRLDFQYSLDATSLTTGTWTDCNALDFDAPKTANPSPYSALNPADSGNSTPISSTITGLSIAAGQTFWLRWTDLDGTDIEQGLGIDDFSLSAVSSIPEPSTTAILSGLVSLAVVGALRRSPRR